MATVIRIELVVEPRDIRTDKPDQKKVVNKVMKKVHKICEDESVRITKFKVGDSRKMPSSTLRR